MNLYTIIFEYRGGTYITQIQAAHVNDALYAWGQELDPGVIQFMGKTLKAKLNREIAEILANYPPVPLTDMKNCWCVGTVLSGLVNIIQTDQST